LAHRHFPKEISEQLRHHTAGTNFAVATLTLRMKANQSISVLMALVLSICANSPAQTSTPEVLYNFQLSIGSVTGTLIQGPDGNFFGTTTQGGPSGSGTVFRVTPAGVLTTLVSSSANPAPGLVVGNDGLLYGMNETEGGPAGFGSVFKMTTGGAISNFAIFDGVNGGNPQAGLVLAGDGNFYGASQEGGTNSIGAVFRVTPAGVITPLVSFDGSTLGGFPVTGLTLGPDGNLYGTTSIGGTVGRGTIFRVTLAGNLTTLYSFQNSDGSTRSARLTLGPDGNLYGASRNGGSNNMGTIYRIGTNGVFTNLVSFAGTNGSTPWAELTLGADSQLYGTTQLGGSASQGTAFKVSTNGSLTTLVSFPDPAHGGPKAGLLLANDGNFYGCSAGDIFKMTPGGTLTSLVSLLPLTGNHPEGALVIGPDGNFYGTTRDGGSNSAGTIFRITAGGNLTSLFSFNTANGSAPQSALALGVDGNFYGTTTLGGAANSGTAFRFSTNGTFASLASFGSTNGTGPQCQLVADAAGNFYGNAPNGGTNFAGTIFRLTTNGVLTTLATFDGTSIAFPDDDALAIGPDGNIYGTTANGGTGHFGTVFKMTPAGALTRLFSFGNTNGEAPQGGLLLGNDGNFYGNAAAGSGPALFGTLFRITTNGTLTTLYNLQFSDGEQPSTRLIQGNDGSLYGTAQFGGFTGGNPGSSGLGTVFRITTNGAFTLLAQFQGTNGANPSSSLLLGPDGNLYGTTANGGTGNGGTIFRIVLAPHLASITRLLDGSILITGTGPSSNSFRLWASVDLSKPIASWTQLTNGVFAADGTFIFTDTVTAAVPAKFYRVSTP
jgi:uncharacterized repeat protein (TIGR03803 family)